MADDSATLLLKKLLAPGKPIRIVSIDGGGIYGLASALWLKELCLKDPTFLSPEQPVLFAGISSGAVNALLLAKEENPRQAVLDGKLEAFWKEPISAFSNTNPWTAYWSLLGVGGWFSKVDFESQLAQHFGELKLGDLPHAVLVATFNWAGLTGKIDFTSGVPYAPEIMWGLPFFGDNVDDEAWRPKIFTNYTPLDPDLAYLTRDVLYGAATPPGWRAMKGGIGDAGIYSASPTVEAIASVVSCYMRGRRDGLLDPRCVDNTQIEVTRGQLLDSIAALSISDGSVVPHYWLKNFDFSGLQFSMYPTNPFEGQNYPPSATIGLDASAEEVNYIARNLLGRERYFRLDAEILGFPTLAATQLSRFPLYKDYFVKYIEAATKTLKSNVAVDEAVRFLSTTPWTGSASTAPLP